MAPRRGFEPLLPDRQSGVLTYIRTGAILFQDSFASSDTGNRYANGPCKLSRLNNISSLYNYCMMFLISQAIPQNQLMQ